MPRLARLDAPGVLHHIIIRGDAPGVLHHIIIRGIERLKIFRVYKNRDNFTDRLSIRSLFLPETQTAC
jgi:hypothetical protein